MRKFNFRKLIVSLVLAAMIVSMNMTCAFATGGFGDSVSINTGGADAGDLMGKIIGILLTITRYVGVALVIYGVYEVVMSFMQNQPEAKTKGIVMALAGVAMIALKSILSATGVIS
jgi:hypothetical protein